MISLSIAAAAAPALLVSLGVYTGADAEEGAGLSAPTMTGPKQVSPSVGPDILNLDNSAESEVAAGAAGRPVPGLLAGDSARVGARQLTWERPRHPDRAASRRAAVG